MTIEKKISVIIPVYNAEGTIKKCVQSVTNQTYTNLEIIVINDGSTDSTALKLKKIEAYDKRIKVIHIKNNGVSNARNVGLDCANGEYITFLDSDDEIDINIYEKMINRILCSV